MKKKLLILAAILFFNHLGNAQLVKTHCQMELSDSRIVSFIFETDEILQLNARIPIEFSFNTYKPVDIDSVKITCGNFFYADSLTLLADEYDSAISQNHSFILKYNIDTLPYYLKEIKLTIFTKSGIISGLFWVYFTPYNSIEVLTEANLNLNRKWIMGDENLNPVRYYVPLDSIALAIDTALPIKYKSINGLAYLIPVNYDTAYNENYIGSGNSNGNQKLYKSGIETFRGNVSGTLLHQYANELGVQVNLMLEGIKVLVWKERKGRGDKLLAEGTTNVEGAFDINYNHDALNIDGEIKIYVQFLLENDNFSLVWSDVSGNFNVHDIFTENRNHNLSNGDRQFFDFGTLPLQQFQFGQVFHWAYRAVTFAKNELEGLDIEWKGLNIIIAAIGEVNIVNPTNAFYSRTGRQIQLNFQSTTFESTTYHEVGHYLQHMVQNEKWPGNTGGTHTYIHNNKHPNQTITEGFANGFQFIIDSRFFTDDNESSRQLGGNGGVFVENYHNVFDLNIRPDLHGFTSEAMYGCALLDLWDSESKFDQIGNEVLKEFVMDWDGSNIPQEQADFTFKEICMPFYNNRSSNSATIQNIPQYFNVLSSLTSTCVRKGQIRDVTGLNLINTLANTTVNFRAITTDNIKVTETIEHINHDLFTNANGAAEEGTPTTFTITYTNLIDFNVFDDNDFSITPVNVTPVNGVSKTWNITDPITIDNERALFFNSINRDGFLNGNTTTHNLSNTLSSTDVCNDITVIEGTIEIGNSNAFISQKAQVNMFQAHLNLGSNSILIINEDSKLVIDDGATLHIFPGSRIILNGDNAVLEIKGTLNVHTGATFTFEGGSAGSGHVIFNTTGKNNIELGNNSRIRFVGTGNSDRVMEVMADYTFWPDNIQTGGNVNASFEIENGLVSLGRDAILNIGTGVKFSNVRFYAEPLSKARGIVLWGQKHSIQNVTLENVAGGIQSFNNIGGYPLTMANVTISGANTALLSEGKGSTLSNFYSNNNPMGITINGSIWPNTFNNPHVSGSTFSGTLYTGGVSSSNLMINKANYHDNIEGVNFTGEGSLVLNCGRFHNVLPSTLNRNGITQRGGTLILTDALGYAGGRVSFKDNKNTIFLNRTKHYLDNGFNDLSFLNTTGSLALRGTSAHFTDPTGIIEADKNLWDGGRIPTTLCPLSPLASYQNYHLLCRYRRSNICVNIPYNSTTNPIINPYQFEISQYERCITLPGGWYPVDKGTKTTTKMISTTRFPNTNLQDAVGQVLDGMYHHEVTLYSEIISLWAEILTQPEYLLPLSEEDYYYIDLVENKMMETVGMMLSNDTTLLLSQSGLQHFNTILNAQNYWLNKIQNDTSLLGQSLKNIFSFDKGSVYHLEGENTLAQTQWTAMQPWADELYLEHTNYWLCQLIREEAIKNCGQNPDSLANIPECAYSQGNNTFSMKETLDKTENKIQQVFEQREPNKISKHLTLYPNPATTSVTAELETSQKGTAAINIYSLDGKCVQTTSNIRLQLGINKLIIPTADLVPGIYTIAIETRNIKWNEKVVIK